jgi:hypothetical protein
VVVVCALFNRGPGALAAVSFGSVLVLLRVVFCCPAPRSLAAWPLVSWSPGFVQRFFLAAALSPTSPSSALSACSDVLCLVVSALCPCLMSVTRAILCAAVLLTGLHSAPSISRCCQLCTVLVISQAARLARASARLLAASCCLCAPACVLVASYLHAHALGSRCCLESLHTVRHSPALRARLYKFLHIAARTQQLKRTHFVYSSACIAGTCTH